MADPADRIVLNGTTLYIRGPAAGKPISEWTSGMRIGKATYDDRQHAFYVVLDDFSAGFGHRLLDIREALGTHWDNPGGVDLRRSRHITLAPKRYRVAADTNPLMMAFSAEILDGASIAIPRDDPAAGQDSYLYMGAGDTVYRMSNTRTTLLQVATWVATGAAGKQIDMASSIVPPVKMTRMFLFRSPSDLARRLYVVTHDNAPGGPTSPYFFTVDPGVASPTWVQGVRFLWDAIPISDGPLGSKCILAQETQFRFIYSTDPLKARATDDINGSPDLTDWNIDSSDPAIDEPIWIANSVCRFIGEAEAYWSGGGPAVYFIDYGDGQLYALNFHSFKAYPIPIGNYHYMLNGVIWNGQVAVTDGIDVWLYSAGGGAETVRKIGILDKDGVPETIRDGRYRITGLVDGGRYLYGIAEYVGSGYVGFMVLVYNGVGWSVYGKPVEVVDTTEVDTANPIASMIDRFPSDVRVAAEATAQAPVSRALNVLCQAKPVMVGPATDIAFVDGGEGADTITQVAEGFGVFSGGDTIYISGSTSNDGAETIVSVTAGEITLATGRLTAEGASAAVTISRTPSMDVQLHSFRLPVIGHIPIDGIDEFEGNEEGIEGGGANYDHEFITGWLDMGFRDIKGTLFYLKVDMQSAYAGSRVVVYYRLDDDEAGAWTALGTASEQGTPAGNIFQFESVDEEGVEFRTVQFKFDVTRINGTTLDGGINDSVTTITVPTDGTDDFPSVGVIQIETEAISYTGKTSTTFTGCTREVRGTTKAAHSDGIKVYSLNRTPEIRAFTIVSSKKSVMRQTWVVEVDANKMVEEGLDVDTTGNGTPDTAATQQNIWNFFKAIKDLHTLVKLVVPEAETSVMVEIADFTRIMDDNRTTGSVRGNIQLSLIEPVKA